MSQNGDRVRWEQQKLDRQETAQEERDQRQLTQSMHQQNVQMAEQIEQEKAIYLDKLMDTKMTDAGVNLLDNMVDQAFILGNISDAEYHDIKWQMQAMFLKIKSNFPPEESCVTGEVRAFVLDDRDENLRPLTGQQRTIIAQMIRGVMMLVSRSKEGFQQEMNVKSISVSEVMNPNESDDDGLKLGLFGG